jgi:hypothetical protein
MGRGAQVPRPFHFGRDAGRHQSRQFFACSENGALGFSEAASMVGYERGETTPRQENE